MRGLRHGGSFFLPENHRRSRCGNMDRERYLGLGIVGGPASGIALAPLQNEARTTTAVDGKATPMSLGITQAHCNSCGSSTNHDILASERRESTLSELLTGHEDEQQYGFVPYDLLRDAQVPWLRNRDAACHIGMVRG